MIKKLLGWFKTKKELIRILNDDTELMNAINSGMVALSNEYISYQTQTNAILAALAFQNGGKIALSNEIFTAVSSSNMVLSVDLDNITNQWIIGIKDNDKK